MQGKNKVSPEGFSSGEDVSQIAISIFDKVREIKKANPEVSKAIDKLEAEIRERLVAIKKNIDKFNKKEKDLVTILVINGLHRTADEILID